MERLTTIDPAEVQKFVAQAAAAAGREKLAQAELGIYLNLFCGAFAACAALLLIFCFLPEIRFRWQLAQAG